MKATIDASSVIATLNYLNCEKPYSVVSIDELQGLMKRMQEEFPQYTFLYDINAVKGFQCEFGEGASINGNLITIKTEPIKYALRNRMIKDEELLTWLKKNA